jgi:hypothetical protein
MKQQEAWWNNSTQQVKSWTGYDGSPNVEQVTNGHVKHLDLSKPQDLGKTWDWVMSLEVGEHIPKEFEYTYLTNVLKPVSEGIVLSWARRGQGGRSHVNELNNTEVVERLDRKGFYPDMDLWEELRKRATLFWFKNTLMVFRPNVSTTAG